MYTHKNEARPWTDDEIREGFALGIADERFGAFTRELREWWERKAKSATHTVPRAAGQLGVTVTQMRNALQLSGAKIGPSVKSPTYCSEHGPMEEPTIRDKLCNHCEGCEVRTSAALLLLHSYKHGATLAVLSARHGVAEATVRKALIEVGAKINPPGHRSKRRASGTIRTKGIRLRLGSLLLLARLNADLTGDEVGRRAGISQSKVSKLENGNIEPKLADVINFADACEVPDAVRREMVRLINAVHSLKSVATS